MTLFSTQRSADPSAGSRYRTACDIDRGSQIHPPRRRTNSRDRRCCFEMALLPSSAGRLLDLDCAQCRLPVPAASIIINVTVATVTRSALEAETYVGNNRLIIWRQRNQLIRPRPALQLSCGMQVVRSSILKASDRRKTHNQQLPVPKPDRRGTPMAVAAGYSAPRSAVASVDPVWIAPASGSSAHSVNMETKQRNRYL